jgi:O-antigen/teichoic acid export membrane protein
VIEPVGSIVGRSIRAGGAPGSLRELLRSASVRQGGVFLGSRAANGLLGVLQVFLVTRAVGPAEAGRFFVLWTAAWLLSVIVKFGADGILPRAVAEARLAGAATVSIGRVLGMGVLVGTATLPIVMTVLGVPLKPLEVGLVVGLAGSWAANGVVAALLKAHGRADLSGIVANVVWPIGGALAPLLVLVSGGDWVTIAWLTLAASVASLIAAGLVAVGGLGRTPLRNLIRGSRRNVPVERDEIGAAVLTTLYEVVIWLPVLIGGLLEVTPAAAAGLFAATRVAGLFSWGYQAVLTVLVPRIAETLARRDAAGARRVLMTGSLAGAVVTWPLCFLGILLADPLLGLLDASYDEWSGVLVLLILARAIDAATGPLGEALLVGRRTWVDISFVVTGVVLGVVTAKVLYEPTDPVTIGVGAAAGFVVINLLRVAYVASMLRGAQTRPSRPLVHEVFAISTALGAAALSVGVALAIISVSATPDGSDAVLVAIAAAMLAGVGLLVLGISQFGARSALASPLVVVCLVLLCVFALRPGGLVVDSSQATSGLVAVGFAWNDLASTVGIGVLGFAAFGTAFLLAWRLWPRRAAAASGVPPSRRVVRVALGALAVGSLLWGALFLRNGGFGALVNDPASLHLEQFSGGYGVFGYMLCLAVALLVLWAWLRRPTRMLGVMLGLATVVSVVAALALQTRGPLIASIAAAAVLTVHERSLSPRRVIALALVGVLLVFGFAYMRTVREHAQAKPLREAIEATAGEGPLTLVGDDFTEVDNFVTLRRLIPDGLPWLAGRSLADVPAAFVPRQLWADKPLPIDFALSQAVFGPDSRAGTPFTLAGELYWNYGIAGVLAGMTMLGAVGGAGWRVLRSRRSGGATVAAAALVGYSYLLLTRPLGPMLLTTVMALVAILILAALAGLLQPSHAIRVPTMRKLVGSRSRSGAAVKPTQRSRD